MSLIMRAPGLPSTWLYLNSMDFVDRIKYTYVFLDNGSEKGSQGRGLITALDNITLMMMNIEIRRLEYLIFNCMLYMTYVNLKSLFINYTDK